MEMDQVEEIQEEDLADQVDLMLQEMQEHQQEIQQE